MQICTDLFSNPLQLRTIALGQIFVPEYVENASLPNYDERP